MDAVLRQKLPFLLQFGSPRDGSAAFLPVFAAVLLTAAWFYRHRLHMAALAARLGGIDSTNGTLNRHRLHMAALASRLGGIDSTNGRLNRHRLQTRTEQPMRYEHS